MQPQQGLRFNLGDLKAQIERKIGVEGSKKYFFYFQTFLSQKLSKAEFDKCCLRVLGRENLPLHNQFVLYILKNSFQATTFPPNHEAGPPNSVVQAALTSGGREDGHEQRNSIAPMQNNGVPILSNGILPVSPRKCRSSIRDRKLKDRPRPLGPNGKVECVTRQFTGTEENGGKLIVRNGEAMSCHYQRPGEHVQDVGNQPQNEMECSFQRPTKKPRIHSQDKTGAAFIENGEEVPQATLLNFSTSPLVAPLGIPFCSASVGGGRQTLPVTSRGNLGTYYNNDGLPDTETLRNHMEKIAAASGLEGVSTECANALNNMLDVYLKGLMRSCAELFGARSVINPKKLHLQKHPTQGKVINGIWPPTKYLHMRNSNGPVEVMHDQRPSCSVSLHDFKVAMELNPQQLGEDWPLLLEKICMQTDGE